MSDILTACPPPQLGKAVAGLGTPAIQDEPSQATPRPHSPPQQCKGNSSITTIQGSLLHQHWLNMEKR